MIGIIINAVLLVAVFICGAVMMCFSLSDIWNYLMAVIPLVVSLFLMICEYWTSKKRKRYLAVLPKMLSLINYFRFVEEDHIKVSLAREVRCLPPLPPLEQTVRKTLNENKSTIQEFSKVFKIKYDDLYNMLLTERVKVREMCNDKIKKLKLTDSESHLLESQTNKHNH